MLIHEAVLATNPEYPCIKRESWVRYSTTRSGGIKIQPTNSPDGCIIESDVNEKRRPGWQPTAADLIADDWIVVSL